MKLPITQSVAWHQLQNDLGETSFLKQTKDYQYLAILKSTPVGKYLYCPYGPYALDLTALNKSQISLGELAEANQAIFIRIEPQLPEFAENLPKKARKSHDLNPKETWILDLAGKDEDFKSKLPSRLQRYHRHAAKKGLTIRQSHDPKDIHYLIDLQKDLAKEKGISTYSEKYLMTELKQPFATLYLAEYTHPETQKTEVVAAGLVFDDQTTRYNLQGAQNEQGRKLHATGILTIQLILDARAKKLQFFDFWGIAPEGASTNHPWAGFTAFKKTFAGQEVNYAGTYDIVRHPAKYKLYQFLRSIRRHLM